MKVRMHVDGLAELQDTLRALPDATARNTMRRVLIAQGEPIAEAARAKAPARTGNLRDSIVVTSRLTKTQRRQHKTIDDDVEVFIGPGPHPQAHLQEFGTAHHAPQPFMRPAWDENWQAVLEGIREALAAEIEKATARQARKAARAAKKAAGGR